MRKPKPGATRKFSPLQRDVLLDRAEVAEDDPLDHVVGGEREEVFERVEPAEFAADADAVVDRRSPAEREAAERRVAAREVVFKDRRVGAGEAELGRVKASVCRPEPSGRSRTQEVLASNRLRRADSRTCQRPARTTARSGALRWA